MLLKSLVKGNLMIWQKFLRYVNLFSKRDPAAPNSIDLKLMHGINRISILIFLAAIIVMCIRAIT